MTLLAWSLLADGGADRALLAIVRWSIRIARPDITLLEPRFEVRSTQLSLATAIQECAERTNADVVFVHRDAERESLEDRRAEIPLVLDRQVSVVPVRMTEAWLLIDERSIRAAASNPNGVIPLPMPKSRDLEGLPDPKDILRDLLVRASESSGRRLEKYKADLARRCHLVAEEIESFAPLRGLPAFRAFEADLGAALRGF